MKIFSKIFKGLISPYLLIKKYIYNSISGVNAYKYICITSDNKKESDYLFVKESVVNNFLITENKRLISFKTNNFIKFRFKNINKRRIKDKELVYFLVHLNKYLNSGSNMINAISIIIKKCKYKNLERILRMVRYDLMCGNSLSESLAMQGNSFPTLLINVLKDKSVDDNNHLGEMEEYYKSLYMNNINNNKLVIYKIFIVPYILMISMFILGYIIPKFYTLYNVFLGDELLLLKKFIVFSKYDHIMYIVFLLVLFLYLIFIVLRNIKMVKNKMDYVSMLLFKSFVYKEMITFSKTMALIVKYNMSDESVINSGSYNSYFKNILISSFQNYKSNHIISSVLKEYKLFPIEAIYMLQSGEKFECLLLQINNVGNFYQNKINKNRRITMSFIGPLIIIFSTLLFGSIIILLLLQCLLIIK